MNQSSLQPIYHLDEASKQSLIARYAQPKQLETLSYATVRDFCDSADHLPQVCKLHDDIKNVQRPWLIKTILSQVPLGGKLLEIGGGEPIVCGILAELGYQVTLVDPYEGAGNGPTEYAQYSQQYPHVKIIKDLFSPNLSQISRQNETLRVLNQIDSDYAVLSNQLKEDVETYYLSATGHYLWRGNVPYDQFPFRKVVSIQSCIAT